jgi:E3 ubiquitin-protein ligase HUWE1
VLDETFSVTFDYFGKLVTKELIEGGAKIDVTNENKTLYIEKTSCYIMYDSVKSQIDAFLQGIHELIPKKLIKIFTASELDLLISGLPTVDCK